MKAPILRFYGGVNEVGGNKILLEDKDTRILLDFGMSFSLRNRYYSDPFLSPRGEDGLLEFGLLPKIRGVYKFEDSESEIDGVFLSHSHVDHAAYISFLKREIPVYCGEATATILRALGDIRIGGFEFDISGIRFNTFRTGDRIRVGSLEIEPIHVDHSVPGSYGFIIHTSAGAVAYTGDFRRHGSRPDLTEDFIGRVADEKPLAVISEGTNAIAVEVSSESEIMDKINMIVGRTSGMDLANFACADLDRLRSFYEAAKGNDRYLVVTLKQAYLLDKLSTDPHLRIPSLKDESLLIFRKTKKRYYSWEKEAMKLGEIVDSSTISKIRPSYIVSP